MTRRARVWYCHLCGKMNSSPGKLSRHMGKAHSSGIMLEANWTATKSP